VFVILQVLSIQKHLQSWIHSKSIPKYALPRTSTQIFWKAGISTSNHQTRKIPFSLEAYRFSWNGLKFCSHYFWETLVNLWVCRICESCHPTSMGITSFWIISSHKSSGKHRGQDEFQVVFLYLLTRNGLSKNQAPFEIISLSCRLVNTTQNCRSKGGISWEY